MNPAAHFLWAEHAEVSRHITACCGAKDGTCSRLERYGELGYLLSPTSDGGASSPEAQRGTRA